jgi:redox-sensitive bicupin YhaK (pirin superfamily)
MPEASPEGLSGFQLWVNLPAKLKMSKPRYQEIKADKIPVFEKEGVKVKVIAGEVDNVKGAVSEIYAEPNYLDVMLDPNGTFIHPIAKGHNAFAYIFEGSAEFDDDGKGIETNRLVIFNDGDFVKITADEHGARFLLVSGKPLNEPVSRYGPFVMNTREEIHTAIKDLQNGTFNWTEDKEPE